MASDHVPQPGPQPVALDAMGGDKAPEEIVKGARIAYEQYGIPVVLVGQSGKLEDTGGIPVVDCSEVIAMDEDPALGVRRKKDSSLVRSADLVRDGKACAMVSAGNTGATMASALFRIGRVKGIQRPAIATPIPNLAPTPTVLLDSGANVECSAGMLAQFAMMGAVFSSARYGIDRPRVGLLSIGEEAGKGNSQVKEAHEIIGGMDDPGFDFTGNVEGRDLMKGAVDVVVTDGFTGNVALKALEGALGFFVDALMGAIGQDESTKAAGKVLFEHLAPVVERLDPDSVGGAMLLGIDGICIISHGSSSAKAITSALRVAHDLSRTKLVAQIRARAGA
ncbi:MAG: phosphate acyltransferase PlsX [Actinobacteria bacterium]|nr:phosphate acyltransferase PlsX [Actinomycetota bacterium]MCL5445840.1 phosphate acyltransferase PlsX [Actinomycetota bacterium]